jgi:hypothetical protein
VSTRHTNYAEYWNELSPLLNSFIESQRDHRFETALTHAFAYFSFVTEEFPEKVQRNRELLQKLTALFVIAQDAFRGLGPAMAALSPVSLAALTRIALEARVNLRYIATSTDPAFWADRFHRYARVEKLIRHDARLPDDQIVFPEAELQAIRANCREWIKPNGKIRKCWTADDRNLHDLAEETGLVEEYVTMYGATSKFVHASAIVANAYSGPNGVGPIGRPAQCRALASLGAGYCLHLLEDGCELFGVSLDKRELTMVSFQLAAEGARE